MNHQSWRKREGINVAREWCRTASLLSQITIAGCGLEYGETLDTLIEEGYDVPSSSDRNFSWGFYKHVKGKVHDALYRMKHGQSSGPRTY